MGKGIYVATSGSIAQLRHMEVLSNNLANGRTTGFKADRVTFQEVLAQNVDTPVATSPGGPTGDTTVAERNKHFVDAASAPSDMTFGSLTRTDNPLDVAITGNGMLKVDTARGVRLTRGGQLVIGKDGVLMTHAGNPVLSDKGKKIVMPPDEIPEIDGEGRIFSSRGELAKLAVATPDMSKGMKKDPDGLFVPATDTAPSPDLQIMQGHIEESNASPIRMMLELINVQRTFSALRQVITASGEMDTQATRLAR